MRVFTALVIFCLFASGPATSVQTRTISGTVVDPAGQGIPGVAIELRNGPSAQRRTTSDSIGAWKFDRLEPGDYVIRFVLSGFVTTDLQLKLGESSPAPVRLVLKVGALSETVTVIGGTPSVRLDVFSASRPPAPPPPAATAAVPYMGSVGAAGKRSAAGGHYGGHIYPPPP